jgi:hypothetical protein
LLSERHELGLTGPDSLPGYLEGDPLEFFHTIGMKPRTDRHFSAWLEPKTKTIMIRIV